MFRITWNCEICIMKKERIFKICFIFTVFAYSFFLSGSSAGSGSTLHVSMTTTALGENTTEITLSFDAESEPTCLLDYGGDEAYSTNIVDYQSDTTLQYTHESYGFYNFHAFCMTDESTDEKGALDTYVGEFVTGLNVYNAEDGVVKVFAPLSGDIDVDLRVDEGTNVRLTAMLLHNDEVVEISDAAVGTENLMTFAQGNFGGNGIYSVQISAENPITTKVESIVSIAIQEEIIVTDIIINGGTNYVEVFKPFDIEVTLTSGEDVTIAYDLVNESDDIIDVLMFVCDGTLRSHSHTYMINSTGTFNFSVSISNMVSVHNVTILVVSEYAVNEMALTTYSPVSLYSTMVTVFLSAPLTTSMPVGMVICTIDYGDTNAENVTFDLQANSIGGGIQDSRGHDYVAGFYKLIVTCRNEIPTEQIFENDMRIENPVEHIHLETDNNLVKLSVGIALTVKLDTPSDLPLYLINCEFSADDTSPAVNVLGNITSDSNISYLYKFQSPGNYTITVTCSANLTNHEMSVDVHVYWDCWQNTAFFDAALKSDVTPTVFYSHEPLKLKGAVTLTPTCKNSTEFLQFIWKFLGPLPDADNVAHTVTIQSQTYDLPADTLNQGKYKVVLDSLFTDLDASQGDYMYIESKLADLVPVLKGSPERQVTWEEDILIDASDSFDPAEGIPEIESIDLIFEWSCYKDPSLDDNQVSVFFASGGTDPSTIASESCGIALTPNVNQQTFQTASHPEGKWYIFKVTMRRGARSKSAIQAVKPIEGDPINCFIKCKGNCHGKSVTGLNKILEDILQLEVNVEDEDVLPDSITYEWSFERLDGSTFIDLSDELTIRDGTGMSIPGTLFESGKKYRVSCNVMAPGKRRTPARQSYIRNIEPYDGTCIIDRMTGKSGLDDFCVTCSGWKDEDDREERSDVDTGAQLFYDFIQYNEGADVSEIILKSSNSLHHCMNLASPPDGTNSSVVKARIKDKYGRPSAEWNVIVTVEPALNTAELSSTGGSAGATDVQNFADSQTEKMENAIATGDTEKLTSVVAIAVSNIVDIKVEAPPPVIEEELDDDGGGILDVVPGENGTDKVVTLDEALEDFNEPPVEDPTTTALKESLDKFTDLMTEAMEKTMTNTSSSVNPVEMSQTAIAFKGILATDQQNIKHETKNKIADNIERMSEIIYNGQIPADNADTRASLRDVQKLEGGLIAAVVPPELTKVKPVTDMVSANIWNQALYDLADEETKALREQADMGIDERNFAALKLMLKIRHEVSQPVESNTAQKAANAFLKISEAIQHTLNQSAGFTDVLGEEDDEIIQLVTTNSAAKMAANPITSNSSKVEMKGLAAFGGQSVKASITQAKHNVFMYDEDDASSRVTSSVSRLKVDVPGTLGGSVVVKQNIPLPTYTRTIPFVDPDDASQLSYYITLVQSSEDMLCIACRPVTVTIDKYTIYINYGKNPTNIDYVAKEDAHSGNDWNVCFVSAQRPGRQIGKWNYGVRTVLKEDSSSSRRRRDAGDSSNSSSSLPEFDMATATMACMTWDSDTSSWKSDACDARWIPDDGELECTCSATNNELTFGNSFYVPPNSIDFSSVFLKFSPQNQAAVLSVLIIVIVIYILVVIWARRQDKKDLLKWGITPLVDNFPEDNYFYVVKVYTGIRPGAGTKSKVAFVVSGDEMDSGVRELSDGIRKDFKTGSIVNFLLSTNSALGQLEYMRIWHDNSGGGSDSSWYLSKIEVQDVQLNETFIFQAERWLAVEKEDGAVECVIPVNKKNDLNVFRNRFFQNAKDNLADNHIWISVVYRPASSTFTRVQRATCALVFVLLTMIANAMFFQSEDNYETPAVVRVGPFRFSLQQIYISVICALISTPPTILIIYLFKMSKRNLPNISDDLFRKRRARKYTVPLWDDWVDSKLKESMELEQHLIAKGYPQLQGCFLPSWCNYIAWFLAFAAVFLSAFFIMLYSMQWGKQKSEEWLTTFLLSFFESVIFLDPIKIAMMALVFALIFRAAKDSLAMIQRKQIMKQYSASLRGRSSGMRLPAPPLDSKCLEEARVARQREVMMRSAFKNIVINLFICWILFSISYSNRDNRSYFLHRDVHKQILAPDGQPQFMDIKSINGFFDWFNNSAILRLFPEEDVNGDRLHWRERQFITGGAAFRLGPPRLRQLRVKKDTCSIPGISTKNCYGKYYSPIEETQSYCIGWKTGECSPNEEIYQYSSAAWKFTSALDIWGFPITGYYTTYGGGGYIAVLDVNRDVSTNILNELYENSWVDRQTRAVILEFTIYCLNANIFMYNMFMVEFPETGGAFPFHILLPLRVYQHNGSTGIYTLACEIIFVIFLLILTIQMIINMVQQKRQFFRKPWQVLDMVIIIIGYAAVVMYAVRFAVTSSTIAKFTEDKKQFVNFYHIALWDGLLVLLIGTLDFMVTIRLLNILGYNKRISAVARVFTTAASDLLWFGIFFVNIFTCYAVFGYLLFGSKLKSYMNVYATMGTLFISMIGKSRFTEIDDTDPVMSKIYFMIFIFFVVYCILTMFLAVLSKSIENVHSDVKQDKGEEMVEYLLNKFKNLIGYGERDTEPGRRRGRGRPPAPWTPQSRRFSQLDNRSILQSIRMSLHDALKETKEEEETHFHDHKKAPKKKSI